ncbi:MAG: FAD-binding protein [Bacillota bacterium]|jgi:succinate dehydrogenase / fumarate reductase flavoprotein subunit
MRTLAVGNNAGSKVPLEVADILEAYSWIDPQGYDVDACDISTDMLVIGGGGGGATAALVAQANGANVVLATKLRLGDSNTVMAEGGIAAATKPSDTPVMHYVDTMGGGRYANSPELVKTLVHDAPLIVKWLKGLGVMFDQESDGTIVTSFAGGHSRRRVHSCKDFSGLEMMRVLRDEIWNKGITVVEFSPAVDLVLDENGHCAGAILQNLETGNFITVRAGAVILATGGLGRLHIRSFPTTNHYGATADGLAIAYRAGASVLDMDSVQYHPTGVAWPEQMLGNLVTEALRGNGAHLVNVQGNRFINELETRDTTSSAIIRECVDRNLGVVAPSGQKGVWLDVPVIDMIGPEGTIQRLFAGIVGRFLRYGIDVKKEPILVFPTQHYQNGGLKISGDGLTDVPGLFAAGEVSGGVHGRNRLGGNSLVDIFVFGRRAGLSAVDWTAKNVVGLPTLEHVRRHHKELETLGVGRQRRSPRILPDYTRAGLNKINQAI